MYVQGSKEFAKEEPCIINANELLLVKCVDIRICRHPATMYSGQLWEHSGNHDQGDCGQTTQAGFVSNRYATCTWALYGCSAPVQVAYLLLHPAPTCAVRLAPTLYLHS